MYISNNNSKREYTNSGTPNPTSYVYAYKTFVFDKNEVYGLKFKYKSFGEDKKDVMNVFVVSDEIHEGVIEAGNPNGMTEDNNTPPQQWIRVVNDKLNNRDYVFDNQSTNNWKDFVGTFAVKKSGRYKVIFFWKNNNTSGTIGGAAAVDSVSIKMVECAAPFDIDVDLNGTTAIVKWAKGANATSWEVSWGTNTGSLSTPVTVTTPEFHATGINVASEQPYYFKIKTKCSPGEDTKIYSYLPVTPFPFTTSFEVSADNTNWKIGSSSVNKWTIGADPQAVARGEYALYITDNTATKRYYYSTAYGTKSESYTYRSFRLVEGNKYRLSFKWKGKDAYPLIKEALKKPEILAAEPVRNEMFKAFDYYVTESSGHNSEYNPWFRKRKDLIEKYCTHGTNWNPGEYAYILKEYQKNEATWKDEARSWFAKDGPIELERGEEYAAWIINALAGGDPFKFNGNVQNKGYITNLPDDVCVEVPVYVDRSGFYPLSVGNLPPSCVMLTGTSSRIEENAVLACINGDAKLVYQAIAHDPLTSAVLSLEEIRNMTREMFKQNEAYLPQFKNFDI